MLTFSRASLALLLALGLAGGCHAVLGLTDFEVSDTTSGTGASGGAGGSVACSTPAQCPGQDTACAHRECNGGVCSIVNQPSGTDCSGGAGGASGQVMCDGNGHCVECVGPNDCTPPATCQQNQCVSAACVNGQQDGSETAVDCGGSDCPACSNGKGCLVYSDCQSHFCDHGGSSGGGGVGGGTGGTSAGGSGGSGGAGGAPGPGTCAACAQQSDCAAAPDAWCDSTNAGGTCVAKHPNAAPCTAGYECSSGNCPADDLVCCDAPCDRQCESCLGAKTGGATGTCLPAPSGQDPDNECLPNPPCGPNGTGCNGDAATPACNGPCQTCQSLFGGKQYVLEICEENPGECSLRANTLTQTCRQLCNANGVSCLRAYYAQTPNSCVTAGQRSCGSNGQSAQICVCSQTCGANPPCTLPQLCNSFNVCQ